MVRMVGDSKAKKVNTFRGFLIDCYVRIDAMLNGKPFRLQPMRAALFSSISRIFSRYRKM